MNRESERSGSAILFAQFRSSSCENRRHVSSFTADHSDGVFYRACPLSQKKRNENSTLSAYSFVHRRRQTADGIFVPTQRSRPRCKNLCFAQTSLCMQKSVPSSRHPFTNPSIDNRVSEIAPERTTSFQLGERATNWSPKPNDIRLESLFEKREGKEKKKKKFRSLLSFYDNSERSDSRRESTSISTHRADRSSGSFVLVV